MIEKLNLNDAGLVLDRKRIIVAVETEVEEEANSEESQEELLAWWRTPNHEGMLVAFAQVRCRYVEDELRAGR